MIAVVSQVLGEAYYSHNKLEALFAEAGAPQVDPPWDANCTDRCKWYFNGSNNDPDVDTLLVLGSVLRDLMDPEVVWGFRTSPWEGDGRRILDARENYEAWLGNESKGRRLA